MENKTVNILEKEILDREIVKNLDQAKKVFIENKNKGMTGSGPEAYSFIITCLKFLYNKDFSNSELSEIITDGHYDFGIDAVYVGGKNFIDIFDVSNNDPTANETLSFKESVEENIINQPKDYKIFNVNLSKKIKYIHNDKRKIRVFSLRNSDWGGDKIEIFKDIKSKIQSIGGQFLYYNRNQIINSIKESENFLKDWEIKINKLDILDSDIKTKKTSFFHA